jgi:hypothetical protein
MAVTLNASTSSGLVQSADTSGIIELQSNGTTALTVNTNEGIQILNCLGVGNATPSTSGAGITFPATQSASTDANTLDDYEEGTWTPVPTPGSGSITAYTSSGNYTKIGRSVTISGQVTLTTVGTASGVLNINGFPFAFANFTERTGYSLVREDATTGVYYALYGNGNATTGVITTFTNGAVVWTNGYRYSFAFTYQTN